MPELLQTRRTPFTREQYRTLLEVAQSIAMHRDLGELFHALADLLPRAVPLDFINLLLHDPERDVMRLQLLLTPRPGTIRPGMETPVEESAAGLVWKTQEPLVVENVSLESRFPRLTPLLLE